MVAGGVSVAAGETVCVGVAGGEAEVEGDPLTLLVPADDGVPAADALLDPVGADVMVGRADTDALRSGMDAAGVRVAEGLRVLVGDGRSERLATALCVEEREAAGSAVEPEVRLGEADTLALRDPVFDGLTVVVADDDRDARLVVEGSPEVVTTAVSVASVVGIGVAVVE